MLQSRENTYHDCFSFTRIVQNCSFECGHMSLFHVNIRSLKNKWHETELSLSSLNHKFDIMAFTETWFLDESEVLSVPGYREVGVYRRNRRGGGSSLCLKEELDYEVFPEFSLLCDHYESIAVLSLGTLVASVYRPPSGDFCEFLQFLSNVFEHALSLNIPIVFVGDFNIDLLSGSPECRRFCDAIESFGCSNVINAPTRITQDTETLLDLCITNHDRYDITSGILTSPLSDHLPIFCLFPCKKRKKRSTQHMPVLYRNINSEAIAALRTMLEATSWDEVYSEGDPNLSYNIFVSKIKDSYDNAFPLQPVKKCKKSRKPWVTNELYRRIKARDKLYGKFIRLKDLALLVEYKRIRNKLSSDLKKARLQYYTHKFAAISNNPNKIWNCVRDLIGKCSKRIPNALSFNGVEYKDASLADQFNTHFITSGASSEQLDINSGLEKYITSGVVDSLFLAPCSELEISSCLKSLDKNSAPGNDDLKAAPIVSVADLISLPLQHICNSSLATGIFPDKMKIARVAVLHKGGPLDDVNNYRPISVLPVFSKVLERVIKLRLSNFLNERQLLVNEQYGFRTQSSTEIALLNIKNKLIDNFETSQYTVGLFLDFRKAFDSVKHEILFHKLPFYGIRGVALNLIRSYLTDRFQFTSLNGHSSNLERITYGVPQGSILGPLFFIIYINDIVHIPHTPDIILYADDTSLFFSGNYLSVLEMSANKWLK